MDPGRVKDKKTVEFSIQKQENPHGYPRLSNIPHHLVSSVPAAPRAVCRDQLARGTARPSALLAVPSLRVLSFC